MDLACYVSAEASAMKRGGPPERSKPLARLGYWLCDRWTDYRSRYGYPAPHAAVAELWWRLEHSRLNGPLKAWRRRKDWEDRGFTAGHRAGCRGVPCDCAGSTR